MAQPRHGSIAVHLMGDSNKLIPEKLSVITTCSAIALAGFELDRMLFELPLSEVDLVNVHSHYALRHEHLSLTKIRMAEHRIRSPAP